MAYTTSSKVWGLIGVATTGVSGETTLMLDIIDEAQAEIDTYTGRKFEHSTVAATRYFTVGKDTDGEMLYLDHDLSKISSVKTNCDGTTVTFGTTEYITIPRNFAPYHAIKILSSSTNRWDYTNDPENGVQVAGCWSYSTVAPDDIARACKRLAAYMYKQREAQVFDVTAYPEAGVIEIPKGIPADVEIILKPYRKVI